MWSKTYGGAFIKFNWLVHGEFDLYFDSLSPSVGSAALLLWVYAPSVGNLMHSFCGCLLVH